MIWHGLCWKVPWLSWNRRKVVRPRVFGRFAAFEERQGEYERARVIYKHATKLFHLGQEPKKPAPGEEEEEDVPQWEQERTE